MAHTIFNEFLLALATQNLDLETDSIRVALFPEAYTANRDTHQFWSNISASQCTGAGYTAGGKLLTGASLAKLDASDSVRFLGDDVSWIESTITARYAVLYQDTGDPATSVLIAAIDFGSSKSSVNGTFTVEWNDNGILTLGQAV